MTRIKSTTYYFQSVSFDNKETTEKLKMSQLSEKIENSCDMFRFLWPSEFHKRIKVRVVMLTEGVIQNWREKSKLMCRNHFEF